MSVINNNDINKINAQVKDTKYVLPAVVRKEKNLISFEQAVAVAFAAHIVLFAIILLVFFVAKLLGINFNLFNKPDLKPKDIEFVLVEKEGEPIDKNTKNRADMNSRAGGINDPKRPVSLPQTSAPNTPAKKPTPPAPAPKQSVQKPAQPKAAQPAPQQPAQPAPKTPAPRPTPAPVAPKPTANPNSNFNIPIPKSNIPQIAQPTTTAPVTAAPSIGGTTGKSTGGSSSASPSFSPTTSSKTGTGAGGNGTGAGGGGRFANGTGSGQGNVGNPGPGNPKGAPGIDAIKEPDFGPYMKELQRRIKMNWDPPKGNESKRVVLLFSIARDGRLLNVKIHKSSGLPAADQAAIDAVKLTAPFRPLPAEYKRDSVDIQFTFDYNVFGITG